IDFFFARYTPRAMQQRMPTAIISPYPCIVKGPIENNSFFIISARFLSIRFCSFICICYYSILFTGKPAEKILAYRICGTGKALFFIPAEDLAEQEPDQRTAEKDLPEK